MANMSMEKGQAALEYMMTYSWALVVIAIVVGVLIFMGILRAPIAGICTGYEKLGYADHTMDSNGNFALYLSNGTGLAIKGISVAFSDELGGTAATSADVVAAGNDFIIFGQTNIKKGEQYKGEITVSYVRGKYARHIEKITCTGTASEVAVLPLTIWLSSDWSSGDYSSAADVNAAVPGELRLLTIASYPAYGTLTSNIYDANKKISWSRASWNSLLSEGTSITLQTRTSDDNVNWSAWSGAYSNPSGSAITSPNGRYIQYRINLTTFNSNNTPVLYDISIEGTGQQAPAAGAFSISDDTYAEFNSGTLQNMQIQGNSLKLSASSPVSIALPGGDFSSTADFNNYWASSCNYIYDGYAPQHACAYENAQGNPLGSLYLYTNCCTPQSHCAGSIASMDKEITGSITFDIKADNNANGSIYVQAGSSLLYRQQDVDFPSFNSVSLNPAFDYQGNPTGITLGSTLKLYFFAYACSGGYSKIWLDNIHMDVPTYSPSGTFASAPFDLASPRDLRTITWNASLPTGTGLKFQMRSGNSLQDLNSAQWLGPTGAGDYYTTQNSAINSALDNKQWAQYRAFLDTNAAASTPTINSVVITYS
ncbi:MAG: hypothetical protein HYW05_04580 [Candidatus Diapherotrites archaeon]|nr:hypothetical protein [Candidatus Diapherotrites archaeon]